MHAVTMHAIEVNNILVHNQATAIKAMVSRLELSHFTSNFVRSCFRITWMTIGSGDCAPNQEEQRGSQGVVWTHVRIYMDAFFF